MTGGGVAEVPEVAEEDVDVWYCEACDEYGDVGEMLEFAERGIHDCGGTVDVFIRAQLERKPTWA